MNSLIFYGGAQASALASIVRTVPQIASIFTVSFLQAGVRPPKDESDTLGRCTVFCAEHLADEFPYPELLPKRHLRLVVPRLETTLLWPLNAVNEFDEPEPPAYPFGRFPYGDAFVSSCVKDDVPAGDILPHCLASEWPADWPSLDEFAEAEWARLAELDAACDVKVREFIMARFGRERLFWAPFGPTKVLLAELIAQIVRFCFAHRISQSAIKQHVMVLAEPFGNFSVPVHAGLRKHFDLQWYKAAGLHSYFGSEQLSEVQYFKRLIDHSYEVKRSRSTV